MISRKEAIKAFTTLDNIINYLDYIGTLGDDDLYDINKLMDIIEQFIKQKEE